MPLRLITPRCRNMCIGTSQKLMEHSHGKDMAYITKSAIEVIEYVKSKGTL